MTDRDDPTEGFLERWSRKKAAAQGDAARPPDAGEPQAPTETATPVRVTREAADQIPSAAEKTLAFDIASLPSLESIVAATDIRAFLKPGVPAELTRAALRRAWAADPAIRDFKGLQENDWDFNDPNGVPGFGRFAPGEDIKKLLAQVFGEAEQLEPAHQAKANEHSIVQENQAKTAELGAVSENQRPVFETSAGQPEPVIVRRSSVVALQDKDLEVEPKQPLLPRKHGRALPE